MTHQEHLDLLSAVKSFPSHKEWVDAVNAAQIPVTFDELGIRLLHPGEPGYDDPFWVYRIKTGYMPEGVKE